MGIHELKCSARRHISQAAYEIYYDHFFERTSNVATILGKWAGRWETKRGLSDIPMPSAQWNSAYSSGEWDFLKSLDEISRYNVMAGYVPRLVTNPSILDVGCGEGVFSEHCRSFPTSRYVGIDISDEVISRLTERSKGNAQYLAVDAEEYQPEGRFNIIVFNESLYYFRRPTESFTRYSKLVEDEGYLLVSTYSKSKRAMAILRSLKGNYAVWDETNVTNCTSGKSWYCSVFRPNN